MAASAWCHPERSEGSAFSRRSGGLQTGQRDGRERTRCPVAPAFRGRLLFANPERSKGSAFRGCISAKPSCKPCPSPSTNTSTPTAQIPGAKPSASPTNSPPITSSLIHHRQRQRQSPNRNRLQPQPQPLLPRRHQTHLPPPSKIVTAHLWSLSSRSGGLYRLRKKSQGRLQAKDSQRLRRHART